MKHLLAPALLALLGACASAPAPAVAWQDGAAPTLDQLQAMTRYMAPGEMHARLAALAGDYRVTSEIFTAPGAEATYMDSTSTMEVVLGGRVLTESLVGTIMGMPFEGRLMLGYNNTTEKFWSAWADTMGTGVVLAEGVELEDGSVELRGTMVDAMTPEGRPYRSVTRYHEHGMTMEMYDALPDGTEWMVMKMTYVPLEAEDEAER